MQGTWFSRLWENVRFWRGAGALAATVAAALGIHIALEPPRLDPDVIATLDQRLTGIENATGRLAVTPSEISTLATRLAGIENRL